MMNKMQPVILHSRPSRANFVNCACPVETTAMPAVNLSALDQLWHVAPELHHNPLPSDHHLFFNPVGAAGAVVLNAPAYALWQSYQHPQPIRNDYARQLATAQLLQPYAPATHSAASCFPAPTALTAWLHVTNACNLRCTYCYLNKSNERMDVETGKDAVNMLYRMAEKRGYKTVKLKYSGGESTLNFQLIRTLHRHASQLSQQTGIDLQEVVLSNGVWLTDDMLAFLFANQIELSISLDGLGAEHDRQRPFISGASTSSLIQQNIDKAIEQGIRPHISITVTANNAQSLAPVVSFVLDRGLYFNFNFYQEHTPNIHFNNLRAANKRIIDGVKEGLAIIEANLPAYDIFTSLLDRASFAAPHTQTCGAGDNYIVIDHKGKVARCHMEIEHPVSDIWQADPLTDIKFVPGEEGFINTPVDAKEECSTCRWRYWCTGGCSLVTYRLTGRSDVRSPYCDVYQAIFPEILRLEGMRLMKWHYADAANSKFAVV